VVEDSPAREGAEIVDDKGEKIGNITSGCPSPTLKKNIAMGYIKDGMHKAGTEVDVVVRGKKRRAVVTKMPFVPSKYHKQATTALEICIYSCVHGLANVRMCQSPMTTDTHNSETFRK
jgi:aminomethyltransferase